MHLSSLISSVVVATSLVHASPGWRRGGRQWANHRPAKTQSSSAPGTTLSPSSISVEPEAPQSTVVPETPVVVSLPPIPESSLIAVPEISSVIPSVAVPVPDVSSIAQAPVVSSTPAAPEVSILPVSAPILAEVPSSPPAAVPSARAAAATTGKYPFNQIVAYGDELSDNGNGSYARGITGDPANVYGFGTWTNGPVAVSFLSDLLGLGSSGLVDYAFGGCCGGGDFGATLDNSYTQSPAGAQSLVDQISNYTSSGKPNIASTLQFIFIGQNDLSKHTDAFWLDDPNNAAFATKISQSIAAAVKGLLDAGAPYVFVSNIYPKHIAPVTAKYLCGAPQNDCVTTWGKVITQSNDAIKASLAQFGSKAIYYDSFGFITNLANNAAANGFTKPLTSFCDGDGDASWNDCMVVGNAPQYFWMNFIQPTARVHELIAKDMKATIDAHFGL